MNAAQAERAFLRSRLEAANDALAREGIDWSSAVIEITDTLILAGFGEEETDWLVAENLL